jgi:hypothetical protein|nr:MAG: hypothetical protein J07AB56_11900 [Candidatus Nanosalinarum sp. J07AB56]
MNRQKRIAVILMGLLAVSVVLVVSDVVPGISSSEAEESVDCDTQYDRTIAGEMESGEITEDCRPIPESVKNQVLAKALSR